MRANFTPRSQEILSLAKKLAEKFSHPEVTLEHLMLSFIKVDSFLIPFIEIKMGVKFDKLETLLTDNLNYIDKESSDDRVTYSEEVKNCLDYSYNLSTQNKHSYISVEHILYALLNDFDSNILDYFIACDIDIIVIQDILDEILSHDIISDPSILSPESGFQSGSSFGAPPS